MPIFEYRCLSCTRNFSALVGVVANAPAPRCPRCDSEDLQKKVSRFAVARNEDDALDDLASRADDINPDDPRAMRSFMKDMASEMGEDFWDADMDEMMTGMDSAGGDASGSDTDGML